MSGRPGPSFNAWCLPEPTACDSLRQPATCELRWCQRLQSRESCSTSCRGAMSCEQGGALAQLWAAALVPAAKRLHVVRVIRLSSASCKREPHEVCWNDSGLAGAKGW